ncbi:MAG: site-2 protease family protein [Chloroflexi bacterium]|nr:site-2 protease family protein [Chloroflexota bacterium]
MAVYLGDDTPRRAGRFTLNPFAHLDLFGSLLLLVSGFGWAKPVPFNPWAVIRRTRWGVLLVALAGPLSNFILALLTSFGHVLFGRIPGLPRELDQALIIFTYLNLVLALFNLLPLPPLDGHHILRELFPRFWQQYLEPLAPYSMLIFILLLWLLPYLGIDVLTWLIAKPAWWLLNLMYDVWITLLVG